MNQRPNLIFKMRFLFATVILLISFDCYSQSTFYIQNGNNITKVENGDPSQLNVVEWQVRLYKKGAPKTGNNFWGTLKAGTASEVMQKLKSEQEFELKFNAFVGKGRIQDVSLTHFNALGPIAITDEAKTVQSATEENIASTDETFNKVKEYFNSYLETKNKLDVLLRGKLVNPFDNYGRVFKEYTSTLKDAISQVLAVRTLLGNHANAAMDKINQQLQVIDNKLETANTTKDKLNEMIDSAIEKNRNTHDNVTDSKNATLRQISFSNFPTKYKAKIETVLGSGNEIANLKASIPVELIVGLNPQQKIYFKSFVEDIYYYWTDMGMCFGLLSQGSIGYGYSINNKTQIDVTDQYYRDNVLQNPQILQTSNYNSSYSRALLEKGNTAYDLFKLVENDPGVSKAVKNKILQYGIANVSMVYQKVIEGYQDASVVKDKQELLSKLKKNLK